VFREIRRVLKDDGVVWLNLGDTFHGGGGGNYGTGLSVASQHGQHLTNTRNRLDLSIEHIKPKDLIGIPWKVAFALRDDGWYLRQDIIWQKPNCMPESVTDRCTRNHEFVFMLTKEPHYYYNHEVIKEPAVTVSKQSETKINNEDLSIVDMRNKRSVWTIAPKPYKGSHFAVFPPALIEPMILAGCPIEGVVLDPFSGSGTTGLVCFQNSRNYIGIDLNPEYLELAKHRILGMKAPERNPTKEQQSSIPERNPTEEQQSSIIDLFS
jgi:DNA modification methylase